MKCSVVLALLLFCPTIHSEVVMTGVLCGIVVCLFHWGSQFELSVYEQLEQWAQSAAGAAGVGVTSASIEGFSSEGLLT